MTAEEATKLSAERKIIYEKEIYDKRIENIYKRIDDVINEGKEVVYISEYIDWNDKYKSIKESLISDGYYFNFWSSYPCNYCTTMAWGNQKGLLVLSDEKRQKEIEVNRLKGANTQPKKWYQKIF